MQMKYFLATLLILQLRFISMYRGPNIPDPIKLIRRLSALEMALCHLKDDCGAIASRRTLLLRNVMERQNLNVSQVEKVRPFPFMKAPNKKIGTKRNLHRFA